LKRRRECQIDFLKVPDPFHPHSSQIDFSPTWGALVLGYRRALAKLQLPGGNSPLQQRADLLPPVALLFIEARQLAQSRHDPLPRAALGAITLHQIPILVMSTIDFAPIASQEHARNPLSQQPRSAMGSSPLQALTTTLYYLSTE